MKPPLVVAIIAALLLPAYCIAQIAPNVLHKVGIEQRLDAQLPLSLKFRDESGATVRLANYFDGQPVILVLAYYRCPMLCT
ncbi:MAG TPA: hypothetical protein VHU84_19480, partial [Lacipirellulaceae bacterium]|nr:hypothetical protein [Lacipirellulaceae bacterium]